jgi:hypothetical protein
VVLPPRNKRLCWFLSRVVPSQWTKIPSLIDVLVLHASDSVLNRCRSSFPFRSTAWTWSSCSEIFLPSCQEGSTVVCSWQLLAPLTLVSVMLTVRVRVRERERQRAERQSSGGRQEKRDQRRGPLSVSAARAENG